MNRQVSIMPDELSQLSSAQLLKLEQKIAKKYRRKTNWFAVIWAFGNLVVWLSLWPLVFTGTLSLWIAFPIAVLNITLVYIPTHEAQHDIIGRKGSKLRWLNELLGHATTWLMVTPFQAFRVTHLDHHRHTNDPEMDCDITSKADGPWHSIWRSIRERQPSGKRSSDYARSLERNGRKDLIILSFLYRIGFIAILGVLAWNGYALEALFLWWLPFQIAITYITFFLSWAPHHPGTHQGRYSNTRTWKSKLGNLGSMWMQFHIVHHLHPYIPIQLTPAAYWEMKPILEARECRLGL